MSKHLDLGRSRVTRPTALLAIVATLLAALALSLNSLASADTTASPDPVTTASYSPAAPSQSPGVALTGGAAEGSAVKIHIQGDGTFNGINAIRLCKQSQNFTLDSQMSPGDFGKCANANFGPGDDSGGVATIPADSTTHTVDTTFRVGMGTQTWTLNDGVTAASMTCDSTTPCSIWINESTTGNSHGYVLKHYDVDYATNPGVPGLSLAHNDHQLTATVSAPVNTGGAPLGSYTLTLSGGDCGGATPPAACGPRTVPGPTSTFTGLTNFQTYTVSATVDNNTAGGGTPAHYTSGAATASDTPKPPAPGAPSGVPGNSKVTLSWSPPGGTTAPDSYNVVATPTNPAGPDITHTGVTTTTNYVFQPLTNGTVYTFKVQGVYSGSPGDFSASSGPITPNAQLITQTITVRRPNGALVLTQVCGAYPGSTQPHTAPTFNGGPDPLYPQYPYPTDSAGEPTANYPTDCGVALGTAHFLTTGPGAGQFFEATGQINEVTVADTRDTDPGFTVNGQMGPFTSSTGSFSGSELGWTPAKTSQSPPFTDSNGVTYGQTVNAGGVVAPNTPNATGLSTGGVLGSATAGHGLGIGVLDAALKLWIPVTVKTGNYTGVLSITAI